MTVKADQTQKIIDEIEKRAKGKFIGLFEGPDYVLNSKENGFGGDFNLPFKDSWFKEYRKNLEWGAF